MPRTHLLRRLIAILLGAFVLAAALIWGLQYHYMPWGASRALDNAEQFELYSLYPRLSEDEFYSHRILGHAPVVDPAMRKQLSDALRKAARESKGEMMACFEPRHGIRVTNHGQVTDFVICFECLQVAVWRDGKQIAYFTISGSQASVFNAAVLKLGLPPAPMEP